jgi:hypothetical protein
MAIGNILCPFCSTPWSEDNIRVYDIDGAAQCNSGRFEPPTYSISITCHACRREMYRKEGVYER